MPGEFNHYGMLAFGQYVTEMVVRLEAQLYSTCANDELKIEAVKRKYGQLEASKEILKAYTYLYEKDLSEFKKEYLSEQDEPDGDGAEGSEDSGDNPGR